MHKALGAGSAEGEGEDPRLETLWRLVQGARRDWRRWQATLAEQLEVAAREGLLPFDDSRQAVLDKLLGDHQAAIVYRMTGIGEPPVWQPKRQAFVESAYRIGVAHQALDPLRGSTPAKVVAYARDLKLLPEHKAALEYTRRRGAVFMKRPSTRLADDVQRIVMEQDRALSPRERRVVRSTVAGAVVRRETSQQLASRLRDAVEGTPLDNDMDRVARTELLYAHNHGAKEELRATWAAAGDNDLWVFKQISPQACVHCIRLYGLPGNSQRYKLSEIEGYDNDGGNFGLKAHHWRPVTGPTHPNCGCGPWMRWTPGQESAIQEAANRILKTYGVGY